MRLAAYAVLYLLVVGAVALAFGSGTIRFRDDNMETSVKWGNRVAVSREELASWLAARGVKYDDWARKHPEAAARMQGRGLRGHVALEWPPVVHGEPPKTPAAVAGRAWDAVTSRAGVTAAAIAAALLAVVVAVRRGGGRTLAALLALLVRRLRSEKRGAAGTAAAPPPGAGPEPQPRAGRVVATHAAAAAGSIRRGGSAAAGAVAVRSATAVESVRRAAHARRRRADAAPASSAPVAIAVRNGRSPQPTVRFQVSGRGTAAPAVPLVAPRRPAAPPEPAPAPAAPAPTPPLAAPLRPAPPAPAPAARRAAPAAVRDTAAADAVAEAETSECEIRVWHGYVKSQFYALRLEDGQTVALSEPFRRKGDVPERTPAADTAYETFVSRLVEAGWEPEESGDDWFARRFRLRAETTA